MKVYVQGENSLIPLQEEATAESIEEALGYTPADADDIIESISESDDSALYVTDKDGNIITKTDSEGFHATAMTVNGKDVESGLVTDDDRASWGGSDLDDVISKDDDSTLYVTDKDGNIIAKIDKDGLHITEVYIGDESAEQSVEEMITKAVSGLDVDYTETDPTVPEWAKAETKPTYTAEEVGALPDTTEIPDVTTKLEAKVFETHEADLDKHLGGEISTENDEALYICDKDGNIIAQFDGSGLNVAQLKIEHIPVDEYLADIMANGGSVCPHEYVSIQELTRDTIDCTTWKDLQYCSSCGKVHANRIHAEHTYGEWETTVASTCEVEGTQERTCTRCSKKETQSIPIAHTWGLWAIVSKPTCTEAGSNKRTCDLCDAFEVELLDATGHTESEWIIDTAPTATSEGSQHKECTVCGEVLETEAIPKLESESDGTFIYILLDDGTYAVMADNTSISGEVTIPSEYNGIAVTQIADNGFSSCVDITKVIIPDSITYIGNEAFYDLTHSYYEGTVTEWNSVEIDINTNNPIIDTLYYYSENAPTTTGNYWRYVDGDIKVWGVDVFGFEIISNSDGVSSVGTYTNYITSDGTNTILVRAVSGYTLTAYVQNAEYTFTTNELGLAYTLTVSNPTGNVSVTINGIKGL